ncbi:MAG TPA: type II CAAX endopeptidase family protein [Anaerolineales bacterium]|nr:type II CAAX endopeptidase family protein [Anaerolineales bacterium]
MNVQPSIRYPATWEANLLAGSTLITLIVSAGILSVLFELPVVLIVGQLLVIVPALLWIAFRRLPLQATFRIYPISARTALASMLIGVACWPVVAGLSTLLEKPLLLIGPYPAPPLPSDWVQSAAYALTYIVIAPLTEEPIYRGFILQAWLRRGMWVGIMLSGFLFGLLHSQIAPLLPITLLGMVLGLLAYRSRSVLSSIVAHASYNTAATLFVIVPSLQGTQEVVFIVAGVVALPIAALVVWVFLGRTPVSPSATPPRESTSWRGPLVSFLVVLGLFGLMALLEIVMRLYPNLKDWNGM